MQMTASLQFTLSHNKIWPRARLPASAVNDQKREFWRSVKEKKNTIWTLLFILYCPARSWWTTESKRHKKTSFWAFFRSIFLVLSASGKAQKFVSKLAKHFIVHSEHRTPTKICKVQMELTKHISRAIQALISDFKRVNINLQSN